MPRTTHGLSKHSLYPTWQAMKNRCYSKGNKRYEHYGGKGVKVCERWNSSFKNFLDDMGEKPTAKHSLDRINNDGDYEPNNCRWATYQQQNSNQGVRKDNTSGTPGVGWYEQTRRWAVSIKINSKRINLGYYKDKSEAIAIRERAYNNKMIMIEGEK